MANFSDDPAAVIKSMTSMGRIAGARETTAATAILMADAASYRSRTDVSAHLGALSWLARMRIAVSTGRWAGLSLSGSLPRRADRRSAP